MPGIVGIIGIGNPEEKTDELRKMIKSMIHETFYISGKYSNRQLGLWAGWVSHKNSFSDCMPVWNETKDVCIIFSGEDFIDKTEIESLRAKGHKFSPHNASYLAHLYEEKGLKFIEKLNGIFSGLLIDLRKNETVLFNDRYGLNRIYYHVNSNGFYFASEAKALLKVLPSLRKLDITSLGAFFSCGSALQNRSLFEGVSLLPAGSLWTFPDRKTVKKENYFNRGIWENQKPLSILDYYNKLKETFVTILPRYFRGRQKIALSLTGGIDSRMIISAAPTAPSSIPCFTFGGMYRECADVRMAKRIAKICQQTHEVILLNNNFFYEFPYLAERSVYLTDGALDVTGSVGLFVNKNAREIAAIRLTGNYGGEILRRGIPFRSGPIYENMFKKEFVAYLRKAAATLAAEKNCHQATFINSKQIPWHHYNRLAIEQSQLTIRSPYLDNELVALSYQAPEALSANKELAFRFIAECNPNLAKSPTDRGPLSRANFIPFKIRRWCEEFLPRAEYAYDYGMPQWYTKVDHFLAPLHIEKLFLGRQKYYHFRIWYRDQLSDFIKEVLLDPRSLSRSYLNGLSVEALVNSHVRGFGNYTLEIHKLLTTEFIQRTLIEQQ